MRPLKSIGLVEQDENRHLRLSEHGKALVAAIRTKRLLMRRFLSEVLGVAADQAEIDACKLEHLLSNQSAERLVAFLRFLDSNAERGAAFVQAWRAADATCIGIPEHCPTCETDCLAANVSGRKSPGSEP